MAKKVNFELTKRSQPQKNNRKKEKWQKPKLEDVSVKVMAQPYIRFT